MRDAFGGALKYLAPVHYRSAWATNTYYFRSPWPVVETLRALKGTAHCEAKRKGTVRSNVCSTAIRSDLPQESGFKGSRKKDHYMSEEMSVFQYCKKALRSGSLTEDLCLQKRLIQIPSGTLSEADLPNDRTTRLLLHNRRRAKSDPEKRNIQ